MAEKNKRDSSKPQKHGNADKTVGNQDRTREGATPNKAKLPTDAPSDRSRQAQNNPDRMAPDKAPDSDDLDLDLDVEDDRAAQRAGRSGKDGQG